MSEYTKGPWSVDPLEQGILGDVSTPDGSQCVAQAQQISGDDRKQSIRQANARLISAAPELLDALQNLIDGVLDVRGVDMEEYRPQAFKRARDAISKALGTNPTP